MTTEKADLSALRINRNIQERPPRRRLSARVIVPVGFLILVAIAYVVVRGNLGSQIEVTMTTASMTSPSQANAVLNASGYVVAQQKASIASKATGRLVYLGVEEGDHVRKNQIIARIEDQDVAAELERARAQLELARADLFDAERSLERVRTLHESNLASKAELDAAEARHRRVLASIRSAEAAVLGAEVNLENTRIRAPFDGTVLTKNADVGEVVAPFAAGSGSRGAVVTIADMNSLEVETDVSEANITRVSIGQPCEIVLDAYPDRRYPGVVHKIVPTADRAKATVLTKVRFVERDSRVLPEMSAKVAFLTTGSAPSTEAPRLTVPAQAVVTRAGREVVFLVKEDVVEESPVVTGDRLGPRIEIKEGLRQGDRIVERPTEALKSGTRVKTK